MENTGELDEIEEPCCSVLHTKVLTKAEAKSMPGIQEAMDQEIRKFEKFEAFKRVKDIGQSAIKTRWVFSKTDDVSKGQSLKARLCMRGDTEINKDSIRSD